MGCRRRVCDTYDIVGINLVGGSFPKTRHVHHERYTAAMFQAERVEYVETWFQAKAKMKNPSFSVNFDEDDDNIFEKGIIKTGEGSWIVKSGVSTLSSEASYVNDEMRYPFGYFMHRAISNDSELRNMFTVTTIDDDDSIVMPENDGKYYLDIFKSYVRDNRVKVKAKELAITATCFGDYTNEEFIVNLELDIFYCVVPGL